MRKHGLRTAAPSAMAVHVNNGCDGGYAAKGGRDG